MTKKNQSQKPNKSNEEAAENAASSFDETKTVKEIETKKEPYKVRDSVISKGGSYTIKNGEYVNNTPSKDENQENE